MLKSVKVYADIGPAAVENAIQTAIDECETDEEIEYALEVVNSVQIGDNTSTKFVLVIDVRDKEE